MKIDPTAPKIGAFLMEKSRKGVNKMKLLKIIQRKSKTPNRGVFLMLETNYINFAEKLINERKGAAHYEKI
jgi:hypothetical protein